MKEIPPMRLMTWNINSLRLRLPLLQRFVNEHQADIICLQETKVPDPLFPADAITKMGYKHQVFKGMKSYNGVAILSRIPIKQVENLPNWCNRSDCRHIAAEILHPEGNFIVHNFYVPAGGDIPDPLTNEKFAHKLDFLKEVTHYFQHNTPKRHVLVGDLNIAPCEHDVWSHKQLLKIVSHTPIEVDSLNSWLKTGFCDAMRLLTPEPEKLYSWWSYRNKDWKKSNRGRRLDHIWLTEDLLKHLQTITIHKDVRDWESPSDHVPLCLDLKLL